MPNVCTQILLCGLGSELGSQSTCIVGLVFPTIGSSTSNHSIAFLNPNEYPYSPLCITHSWVPLVFFPSFRLKDC